VFFAENAENSVVSGHIAQGGTAVITDEGKVQLVSEGTREEIVEIADLPWATEGADFSLNLVLAAVAAAWAVDVPAWLIRAGLKSFSFTSEKFFQPERAE